MCLEVNSNRVTVMRGGYLAFSLDVPVDGQMMGSSRWAEAAPDYHHPPLRKTTWASVQDEPCTPERHRTSTPITSLTDATWTSPRDMDHEDGANGSILNADVQGRWVLSPSKKGAVNPTAVRYLAQPGRGT
ncbi:uncharacterized protein BO88DRAFT_259108 [Aspergillus vadensis CBS 113365]|uniref:Uncharacterized protein n=1 Tax=Aspergillus vadensis (strain CBS 113365 / IMI 142717 / IBT 24658) TaxID=1448311 RepID=A0A319BB70_ASPVC|nr:hypothetical protein BO88DRAFT_259108 [Aspergillus vadensis CBS 113365]PYH70266.1 hypothetical protein BO88DRAFT_259108 [Aspergillus vadensis CBS 113365]